MHVLICFRLCLLCSKLESLRKAAPWCNFLLQKFGNGMLYCMIFMPDQYKNSIEFGCQAENRFIFMKTKHPVQIMMFGVVISNSNIIPPLIFQHSHRLNMEALIKCLEEVELLWIKEVAAERPYIRQQDCAIPHKQNRVLAVRKFLHPHHS